MFVNKDSIIINGLSMGPFLVRAKFGFHKVWGKDTGRNLAASWSGTLKGIFPKLTLYFGELTRDQIEILAPIFDSATQTVSYYDPNKKKMLTMTTYSNDWELTNNSIVDTIQPGEAFDVAFISTKKRP